MKMRQLAFVGLLLLGTIAANSAPAPKMRILSEQPRITLIENFLTDEECHYLINKAKPELTRSEVVDESAPGESLIHEARTSEGMFFPFDCQDLLLHKIEKKIANLTKMPIKNGEAINVLHYNVGGEFRPHHDYFDNTTDGGAHCYSRGGQRVVTVIMYLNTTQKGGETIFPEAGIQIKPVKGNALLFYNCLPNGEEDPLTLHGGAPVLEGEKWIANKWMRQEEFK